MAELLWLDGYSGQTVDELIAMKKNHRVDSLVLAFEQALSMRAAKRRAKPLNEIEHTILVVEAFEREVNNGGYSLFFANTPEYAASIVAALRLIGCPKASGITKAAIAALKLPRATMTAIRKAMRKDDDSRSRAIGRCDGRFFKCGERIDVQLFTFIKKHRADIRLP